MDDLITRQSVIISTCANCPAAICKYLITDDPIDACEFVSRIYKLPRVRQAVDKNLDNRLESLKSEYNAYHFDDDYWRGVKHAIDILEVSE